MVNNDITLKQETTVELIMWCMLFAFCHHSCYILLCLFYFGCYHQFINMHNFCDNITVVIQHTVAYGSLCSLLLSIFMCVCVSVFVYLSLLLYLLRHYELYVHRVRKKKTPRHFSITSHWRHHYAVSCKYWWDILQYFSHMDCQDNSCQNY